uniref:CSON012394 protein n=1 Tax=Culicoides sonorensis TaxID=179676 RepID=A0A336KJJ3_CULSO
MQVLESPHYYFLVLEQHFRHLLLLVVHLSPVLEEEHNTRNIPLAMALVEVQQLMRFPYSQQYQELPLTSTASKFAPNLQSTANFLTRISLTVKNCSSLS